MTNDTDMVSFLGMKLITRDTDYAVRALCFIAKSKAKVVAVSSMVKALGIPRPFLRKILQVLQKRGLLRSHKGQGGGFSLGLAPNKIRLVDVIKVFQGSLRLNECIFKKKLCPHVKTCPLKKRIDTLEKGVIKEVKGITIKDLI